MRNMMSVTRDIVLYMSQKTHPTVVVNEEGITYNPPVAPIFRFHGRISWPQIAALYSGEFTSQRRGVSVTSPYLAIIPRGDMIAFIKSTYSSPFKRIVAAGQIQMYGGPMNIFQTFIPISPQSLFSQIVVQYRDKIDMYGIKTEKESI